MWNLVLIREVKPLIVWFRVWHCRLRRIGGSHAIAMAATTIVVPAHAASFDCGRASTADERAVCADAQLSELDTLA